MSRKPAKTQHGSTTKPKRNKAPTAARQASSTLADLHQQVSALARELAEAREQQTATSEVLGVISSSPRELDFVFNTNGDGVAGAEPSACENSKAPSNSVKGACGIWEKFARWSREK